MSFKFIDLFAGIGGLRTAFLKKGGVCVFSSEIDKFCQKTYKENFNEISAGDITKIECKDIPDHDLLLAGFPCQPFSIAGVSKKLSLGLNHGFQDKKQGNLFFHIARILKNKRPKIFLLENVKNLKGHDKGRTFSIIKNTLLDLNYSIFVKIIDAVNYVPQHRERIFIAGFNNEYFSNIDFVFPVKDSDSPLTVGDILQKNTDKKYTLSDHLWLYLRNYAEKHRRKGNGFGFGLVDPSKDKHTRTLSARYYKDGSEILIKQKGMNPRRLTPRECARLMGFSDTFKIPVSDTQAYKQFGNSVVVPVIEAIVEKLLPYLIYKNRFSNGCNVKRAEKKEHVAN
ncbi:IS1595 family transposase ISCco3 [subsurface metagenome]